MSVVVTFACNLSCLGSLIHYSLKFLATCANAQWGLTQKNGKCKTVENLRQSNLHALLSQF